MKSKIFIIVMLLINNVFYNIKNVVSFDMNSVELVTQSCNNNVIDVSHHQKTIFWNFVAASGIEFAMIRASYGWEENEIDKRFEYNLESATNNGIIVGAYHYSYARNVEEAKAEAFHFLNVIDGKNIKYVAYDVEDEVWIGPLSNEAITDNILTFSNILEANGYSVLLYSSAKWLNTKINTERLDNDIWVAHWNTDVPNYSNFTIWQYSENSTIPGIGGGVDRNMICDSKFFDYNFFGFQN